MENLFGKDNWLYENNSNNTARFVLGEKGDNPLICIGVNPSTAEPGKLDPTLLNVKAWAKVLGYNGWIMLNLYAQRATNPDMMDENFISYYHRENKRHVYNTLGSGYIHQMTIWAAWGTLIEKRSYLKHCLRDLVGNSIVNHKWITIGKLSNAGHPHHPLYLSRKSSVTPFDIDDYLKKIK